MKTSSILALGAALSSANAALKGFNLAGHLASGACRTENDWQLAFERLQTLPGGFPNVRLYASGDCDTLKNAVPAAKRTGTKLLVGVWTQDAAHFESEKQALLQAVQEHGHDWMLAVSVGSEDLYREETDPNYLAQQIWDVRGMLWSVGASPTIGHVDTWTAWVDPANKPVIDAVDWIGNDAYSYFEGKSIQNGDAKNAYYEAHDKVVAVSGGKEVWTTETGWPITGDTIDAAVPSVQNLQSFWWDVACGSFASNINMFWYILDDFADNPSFAVLDQYYNPLIDMTSQAASKPSPNGTPPSPASAPSPGNFSAVRVYSTQEIAYRPLKWLFDVSQAHNLDLLLGLYLDDGMARTRQQNTDEGRFAVEIDMLKQGLEYAETIGALENVLGISVGTEDLHRGVQRPADIAAMIVKVAEVSDFLAANAFPYWEEAPVEQAVAHFATTILKMDEASKKHGIPVLLGETGWPTDGQYQSVQGSLPGLQRYWNEVFCSKYFEERHAFYYVVDDYGFDPDGPHWGILDEQGSPRIKLECPEKG